MNCKRCHCVTSKMTLSKVVYDSSGIDAKLLHVSDQGGALQTKKRGSATGTSDLPIGLFEGLHDLFSLQRRNPLADGRFPVLVVF